MLQRLLMSVVFVCLAGAVAAEQAVHPAIEEAVESVAAAVPEVAADPARPVFHFRPPAMWMNDPNGPLYFEGWYHVFYQHNPYGDEWGNMHWGHARSRDLLRWEHMPIALWPSKDAGEEHCFSGSALIRNDGTPMIFYTSVGPDRPNEQWLAVGDSDLRVWEKHEANPILSLDNHGGPAFDAPWRDPFLFQYEGRLFMILGADDEEKSYIPLYEAANDELTQWTYRGILFSKPKSEIKFFECPNFFYVDGKWVLIVAPYDDLKYWTGSFDPETFQFTAEHEGIVDSGGQGTFYASQVVCPSPEEPILLGWVRGFQEDMGWNGCMALPRRISVADDGRLMQTPLSLDPLVRLVHTTPEKVIEVGPTSTRLLDRAAHGFEMTLLPGDAEAIVLRLVDAAGAAPPIEVRVGKAVLQVGNDTAPLMPSADSVKLQVFFDKTVLEVFAGGQAITQVLTPPREDLYLEAVAEGGTQRVRNLRGLRVDSIWMPRVDPAGVSAN